MPASSFDLYMQASRNNFDAMRPAPVCVDANQAVGQCQQIHISTNCYYGYHEAKVATKNTQEVIEDCEMLEVPPCGVTMTPLNNARKRSASDDHCPQTKRPREEVQREKTIEPETTESERLDRSTEDLMESLFWNTHGGNLFHLVQCV